MVMTARSRFRLYASAVLAFHLAVILWGAFVRATGSGAGCGQHWPLCNGVVIPQSPATATVIEFTHRITSGLALFSVALLLLLAFRVFPKHHPARRAAAAALFLELMEAVIGAALVLLGHVARNPSTARGYSLSLHLINTLLLLAAITITVCASGEGSSGRRFQPAAWTAPLAICMAGVLLLGVTGTIAALGDTLFRSSTLGEGLRQDFSGTAHPFVRLRVWHPILAAIVSALVVALCSAVIRRKPGQPAVRAAVVLAVAVGMQLLVGMLNLALLAPVALQLVHLLFGDAVWIALVVLAFELTMAGNATPVAGHRPAAELTRAG